MRSGALLHSGGGGTDRSNTLNISIWIMTRERFEERLFFIPFFFIYVRLNVFCLVFSVSLVLCSFLPAFIFSVYLSCFPLTHIHCQHVECLVSELQLLLALDYYWFSQSFRPCLKSVRVDVVCVRSDVRSDPESQAIFPLFSPYPEPAAL